MLNIHQMYYLAIILVAVVVLSLIMYRPNYPFPTKITIGEAPAGNVKYPKRKNMGECPPLFGKITIFVAYSGPTKILYNVAQRTLLCYLKSTNYTLLMIDIDKDPLVQKKCGNHSMLYYKKHCAAAQYLPRTDWMLVLDADTGVVNPNHCIEEWIDDEVDVLLYERFFNWEVAAGNYLVKNSQFGSKFLHEFAKYEFKSPRSWHGNDQGGLMLLLLELLIPDAINEYNGCAEYWKTATSYETFMALVICVRQALGAQRTWPRKLRIYRKAVAFVRDAWVTEQAWCQEDFMFHGWKNSSVQDWETPFEDDIDPSSCGTGFQGWKWRKDKKTSIGEIRSQLQIAENGYRSIFPEQAKVIPLFDKANWCYPKCNTTN